ncbi:hypothetical protein ACVW0I_007411 [Bradyrhizobium sp. LM6.11]
MMPMRIRCKGQPIEKLENPTALQTGGRSFPCDHAIQFTLASIRVRIVTHEACAEAFTLLWPGIAARKTASLPAYVPAIHDLTASPKNVDTRDSPGQDDLLSPTRKIAPRTSLVGYVGFAWQSCGKLRRIQT